ncbi:YbaB/EbfC family nucleoid-associated protein [Kineosporia sp. NBRC 101731]|uniref:YbaB/EbfC family nucleoid-associated protein n=1 Tax=Kineosporia sp. NBRC 101731 TaxID=3032199 RepID=UPI0024A3395D|nr:YbaB/EbfC family nucleoid-associated protein [Kineosporia sp. NBRC 101731]GLY28856.1 hypothetical protein Kisp02_22210 [Kineosporia sp. NBRC 101731]
MDSPRDESGRITSALADLTRLQEDLAHLAHQLEISTIDVSSDDGSITVTISLHGSITGLRFADERHRELSGTELAVHLLRVLTRAREEAMTRAGELTGTAETPSSAPRTVLPGDALGDLLIGLDSLFRPGSGR